MAKAKKLPSGSWRVQVYDYTDPEGKRHYRSFTSDDPTPKGRKKAELEAARYALNKKSTPQCELTFYEAAEQYITDRESILAPSTVREYRRMMKSTFDELGRIKISKLSPELIQQFINHKSAQNAPKTVRNIHGLISAVLKVYAPSTNLNTALPQKIPPKLYIPTDDDIKKLIDSIDNDDMMIAVLLAAFGPLRRSEICGLESTDFNGNVAHIQRAVVLDKNNNWVDKTTKSIAGNRYVPFPSFVCSLIQERSGRIIRLKPSQISDRFIDLVKASGLPHFRFHDLRHYCASIQHAIGIPDAYIMQRGGWKSDTVLKQVYRHALNDKANEMNTRANNYFSEVCNTKCNTQTKNP